jgi:phage shock protein C
MKHLYRSSADKRIAGVCGGIAEYFNVDPSAMRLLWALLTIFSGIFPGVIAYLVAMLIMPVKLDAKGPGTTTKTPEA